MVDTVEKADRWSEFKVEAVPGKAPDQGTPHWNAVIAPACTILWGVPNPTWKRIEDLRANIDLDMIPEKALKAKNQPVHGKVGRVASGSPQSQVIALSTRHSEVAPLGFGPFHKL